jgi:guanine nucleotide-binding protein G(I)/G(S)/G(T) subunit beta-1
LVRAQVKRELSSHTGYLSCCRFINSGGDKILTSSGDMTCMLWDTERGDEINTFNDHNGDVMSVATQPGSSQPNIFVSGACDAYAKVWDINTPASVRTFSGHESDINAVAFFPDGMSFGTGAWRSPHGTGHMLPAHMAHIPPHQSTRRSRPQHPAALRHC